MTPAPESLAIGAVLDGRYRIVRRTRSDGSTTHFEVEHALTGRRLALKYAVDSADFARLEHEARALACLSSARALRVIDFGRAASGAYLVTDLVSGRTLRELLSEAGQLPQKLAVGIGLGVAECLIEAHDVGVLHRDLTPENILLAKSPMPEQVDVKVIDFGVAKLSTSGASLSSLTRTGVTVGTPYYMSLEQLKHASNVDARADMYSLAVVLYESLAGTRPFAAQTVGELVNAIASNAATPLGRLRPELPKKLCEAVMSALASDRDARPSTMSAFAEMLAPYAEPWAVAFLRARPSLRDELGEEPTLGLEAVPGRVSPETSRTGPLPLENILKGGAISAPPIPSSTAAPIDLDAALDRETPTEAVEKAPSAAASGPSKWTNAAPIDEPVASAANTTVPQPHAARATGLPTMRSLRPPDAPGEPAGWATAAGTGTPRIELAPIAERALRRFRQTSSAMQIAIVMGGASLGALVLVLILYAIVR
jgi:serine/threonine-protein kinase